MLKDFPLFQAFVKMFGSVIRYSYVEKDLVTDYAVYILFVNLCPRFSSTIMYLGWFCFLSLLRYYIR